MRICFFNRCYRPDFGATGQLLTELAEDLVREYGCAVTVVAGPALTREPGDGDAGSLRGLGLFSRHRHRGVEILRARGTRFPKHRFVGRAANYLSYFLSACLVGGRVSRSDIVVSLTDPPILGLAALMTAHRTGARFVFVCQDVFPEVASLVEDFESPTVNRLLQWVNRYLVRRADRVVALGETMRERLIAGKGADPAKVTVIHNWADCSAIEPGPKDNPFSVEHGLNNRFVVMHSGNMGLSQNLETLIDAAAHLRSYDDLVFALVGDGVKRTQLEAKVRSLGLSRVHFFPFQPREVLRESFASADVFVVSLKQGLAGYIVPSKMYGILAAGRPVVAAVEEDCEVASLCKKLDCGLLARPGDSRDLAEKILTFYRQRSLARRQGDNARRGGLLFDRPNQVRAYYELFESVVRPPLPAEKRRAPLAKRAFDILLSGAGLLASSPFWLLIALVIKTQDGGPVFYSQTRVGKGGRRFRSWKFRSMVADADSAFGPLQAGEDDPRVTRFGRLLRATAMDELPQLWNIFVGDMSFVGPRALAAQEIELKGEGQCVPLSEIPGYEERHAVVPGLTGIAQIYGARDIPRRQKFRYDLLYARRQSLWLDLRLIAISFWITFRGRWEARGEKF